MPFNYDVFQRVWTQLNAVYDGDANWTSLIPNEWITSALDIPGSAYVIAFVYWLRHPIILCFLLPALVVFFIYLSVLMIHLCRLRSWLLHQFSVRWPFVADQHDHQRRSFIPLSRADLASLAQLMKSVVAALWDAHGRIFHAYEVIGMEKLPTNGPSMVVYYHGTCPFDAYYLISRYCIEHDRFPVAVVDRFLFRMPGLTYFLDKMGAIEGTVEDCAACLNPRLRSNGSHETIYADNPDGCILLVAPGGVREALFSDEFYSVMWGNRCGFAKAAILAEQPIYPMFTENIRESIRVVQFGKSFWRALYERTRLPFALFYGYFPVKLRTYIGDPIYPEPGETPEHLALRTRLAIQRMVHLHQSIPSNLFCALLQRIPLFDRWFTRRRERWRDSDD